MKLKEFEGKSLLKSVGISIPSSTLLKKNNVVQVDLSNKIIKSQIFSNSRAKKGAIRFSTNQNEGENIVRELFSSSFDEEVVDEILVEDIVDITQEYYVAFLFDSVKKTPLLMISLQGGVNIESLSKEKISFFDIDPLKGITPYFSREIAHSLGFSDKKLLKFSKIITSLYECFCKFDLKMIEINPLVLTHDNNFIALDCVSVIDDDSLKRHEFSFPLRNNSKNKTKREIEANKIDQLDYSGVCGRTFVDLDGDIGVLSSGGGASVTAMDALLSYGGKPANFTEYSGNPSYDKVKRLTEIVLDAPLNGLFIVGGRANFTRVDETLAAILDVLIEKNITIPIVIRRAGPGDKRAYELFMETKLKYGLNVEFYFDDIPISKAAEIMVKNLIIYKEEGLVKNVNTTR